MSNYSYHIFYQWQGPSISNIFLEEKSQSEIELALRELPNELSHRLEDSLARIETSAIYPGAKTIELLVSTTVSLEQFEAALVPTLQSLHLFGKPS